MNAGTFSVLFSSHKHAGGWCSLAFIRATQAASLSTVSHVDIAVDGAVLRFGYNGLEVYPRCEYDEPVTAEYTLHGVIDYDILPTGPIGVTRTILSFVTRGMVSAQNCVAVAKCAMLQCGYDVPMWVTTPAGLRRWIDGRNIARTR